MDQPVDNLVPEALRDLHSRHRTRYIAAPTIRSMGAGIPLAGRRRDGTEFPAEISLSSLEAEEGRTIIAAVRDVTERRRLALERDELRARQAERMESLGQLAGGVAHEFNNLLQVILGYDRFVAKAVAATPAVSEDMREMIAAAERAADLTRQLLIFGRRDVTRPEVFNPGDTLAEIAPILRRTVGERIEVHVELGDRLPSICADRGQLKQAIVNLAVNARDAMPRGGVLSLSADRVETDARTAARLTMADTGLGMTPEVQARIFEPFFSSKPMGEGTGLGLATVHAIVAQAGGDIDVHSEEGHGTVFQITFPAADQETSTLASFEAVPPPGGEVAPT